MACFFHKFDKWREIHRTTLVKGYQWQQKEDWREVGLAVTLERDCVRCGHKQIKTIDHVNLP